MRQGITGLAVVVGAVCVLATPPAMAQSLGTFRWQLQPYCNVITMTVVQQGGQYRLDGTDDLCGAGRRASVTGLAFPNPDGTIGVGLTSVTTTGAVAIHIDARLSIATVGGPWTDSAGNSGTLVLTAGAGSGGVPRPIPPAGIPLGSITGAQLAPGSVGTTHLAPGSITAAQFAPGAVAQAVALAGTCPVGQYLRGVAAGGSVVCQPLWAPNVSATADDPANSVGMWMSAAIGADGLPIFSHFDGTAQALRVTKCGNPACTAGNVSTTVATETGPFGASIAVAPDGLPVISSWNVSTFGLRITKCGNAACSAGNVNTTVDSADAGVYSSIAIGADGLPVVSHHDRSNLALRVTKCGNPACTAGNIHTTVDNPTNQVGIWSSIAIGADGLPVISHNDMTDRALRVTKCGNPACSSGNVSTTVDPANTIEYPSSIAIGADGLPVVGWGNRVVRCLTASCSSGAVVTAIAPPPNSLDHATPIAIGVSGRPVVAYRLQQSGGLAITSCGDASCSSGAVTAVVVDSTVPLNTYTSMIVPPDGLPLLGYRDIATQALRVVKCGTPTCR